jgi:hypothetical protein
MLSILLQIPDPPPETLRSVLHRSVYVVSIQVCAPKYQASSRDTTRSKAGTAMAVNMYQDISDNLPDPPFLSCTLKG